MDSPWGSKIGERERTSSFPARLGRSSGESEMGIASADRDGVTEMSRVLGEP